MKMITSKPPFVEIPPAVEIFSDARNEGEDHSSCYSDNTINFGDASVLETTIKQLKKLRVSDTASEICLTVGAENVCEQCNGSTDLLDRGPPGGVNVHSTRNYSFEARISKGRSNLCEELRDDEEEHQSAKWRRPTQEKQGQNQATTDLNPFNSLPSIDPCGLDFASRSLNFLAGYTARDVMSKTLDSFNKNKGDAAAQQSSRFSGSGASFMSVPQREIELNGCSGSNSNVSVDEELNRQGTVKTVRSSGLIPSDKFRLHTCRVDNEAKIMPLMGEHVLMDACSKISDEDFDIRQDRSSCCQKAYSECICRASDSSCRFLKEGHAEIVTPKLTQEDIEDIYAYINTDASCAYNLSKERSALNPVVCAMFYNGEGDQLVVTNFDPSLGHHHRIHSKDMFTEYSKEFVKNSEPVSCEEGIDHYISQMINIYGVLEDSEQPTSTCFSESICLEPKANQIAETVSNMSSVHSLDTDANAEIVYNCLSSVLDNKCDFLCDQTASSSLTSALTNKIELCAQQASVCVENLDDGHVQVQGKYDSGLVINVLLICCD